MRTFVPFTHPIVSNEEPTLDLPLPSNLCVPSRTRIRLLRTVHVLPDLDLIHAHRRAQRRGRQVRPSTAQGGDAALRVVPDEARHHRHPAHTHEASHKPQSGESERDIAGRLSIRPFRPTKALIEPLCHRATKASFTITADTEKVARTWTRRAS